jgi:hypothetical protein
LLTTLHALVGQHLLTFSKNRIARFGTLQLFSGKFYHKKNVWVKDYGNTRQSAGCAGNRSGTHCSLPAIEKI